MSTPTPATPPGADHAPGGAGDTSRPGALRALFVYRLISRAYFHLPVLFAFLYLHHLGIALAQTLLALYGFTVMVSGAFVGRFSAAFGPRTLLVAGEIAKAAGLLLIGTVAGGTPGLVAGQILSGFGYALTASVESPLVGVLEPDRERASKIQARTQSWIFAVVMVSGIAGAVIFQHTRLTVFLLSALACAAAATAATGIGPVRLATASKPATGAAAPKGSWTGGAGLWIAYYVCLRGVALAAFVGFIPYLLFVRTKVSLALFGVLLAVFNVAALLVARWTARLLRTTSAALLLAATLACVAASLVLLATTSRLVPVILAIALLGLGAGAARPLTQDGLSALDGPTRGRVTVRMEQLTGSANTLVLVLGGLGLGAGHAPAVMWGSAAVVAVAGAVILAARPTTRTPSPAQAQALN
ncbi:MFS transporter [Streptomyces hygroscopicus subsp. hygroscopicus]|nr:MFS transporter [Streptomyces hygroscopicus]GLX53929.1 MFS transporter [Streptomyces hygroscopicus subsp. hygroscopicus]